MEAKIKVDTVLDLVWAYQQEINKAMKLWPSASTAHDVLVGVSQDISKLYNDVRRAAE